MSAILHRSCFEPGGIVYNLNGGCDPLPPNVAYRIVNTHGRNGREVTDVTFAEQRRDRRERHELRLDAIRGPAAPVPERCYVWTFLNRNTVVYEGWYCYVVTVRRRDGSYRTLALDVMRAFPLNFLPHPDNFEPWMEAFARTYPRRDRRDRRRAGVRFGWLIDGHFTLKPPALESLPLP